MAIVTMASRIMTTLSVLLTSAAILVSMSTLASAWNLLDNNGCVVEGGVYNEATQMCECLPGYEGIGDLCCTPVDAKDVCWLKGDPLLRSVTNQRVSLNFPCSICVNVMHGQTQDNRLCVWEVLSSTTIQTKGSIYNTLVNIAVVVNRKAPTYFTFDGVRVYNPATNTDINLDANGMASVTVEGETIALKYDNSAHVWVMEGCQNRLLFRAKDQGTSRSPGVCMQATKDSTQMSLQQGNLCNLKASFDDSIPWKIGVLNNAMLTRLTFTREQKASHPDYNAICDKVDNLMNTFCQGISDQALLKCAAILNSPSIRLCLDAMGVTEWKMAALFERCMETFCDGQSSLCDQFKNEPGIQICIPSMQRCDQWPYYF